ncbi:cob(I)yrinic acid a,c-diamide adenosyltransferase [Candidatus Curtissbacteria bacterium]|nr:cob(I)yrinic acid a,c-diamide adenosyltransferase [Candidatus Curtissbacteria bacterium]
MIYTKGGDGGKTSLFGGERVDKNSARIAAYGTVDELNSLVGVIIAESNDYSSSDPANGGESRRSSRPRPRSQDEVVFGGQARTICNACCSRPELRRRARTITDKLLRIQAELFVLGSSLAVTGNMKVRMPKISKACVTRLEKEIDIWEKGLTPLKNFILPGGGKTGAKLHLARAVCRRAERLIVDLDRLDKLNPNVLVYINRLSDWFFVAARYANKLENIPEWVWKGRKQKAKI